MPDSKQPSEGPSFTTRVLRSPITGLVAAAGIAGGTLWSVGSNRPAQPSLPKAGALSPASPPPGTTQGNLGDKLLYQQRGGQSSAPDQTAINALYANIYSTLKSGKEKAESKNKRLAILIGEHHGSYDSLLVELMTLNAAKRLGITTLGLETHAGELDNYTRQLPVLISRLSNRKNALLQTLAKPASELSASEHQAMELYIIPNIINAIDNENAQLSGENLANRTLLAIYAQSQQFDLAAFDPSYIRRGEVIAQTNQSINTGFEDEMLAAMKAQPSHFVGVFGGAHVPYLAQGLPANDYETIVIDASNVALSNAVPATASDRMEAGRKKELTTMRHIDGFIDGRPPINVTEAVARATIASLSDQNIKVQLPLKNGQIMHIPSGREFEQAPTGRSGP